MEQTTQKVVEEAAKMTDSGMIVTLAGGLIAGTAGMIKFIFTRLDKKVSKDVFEEFKKGNDKDHAQTHAALERIEKNQGP